MGLGLRMRRVAQMKLRLALTAAACTGVATAAEVRGLRLAETQPHFGDVASSPLIEALDMGRRAGPPPAYAQTIDLLSVDMGAFQRLVDRRALTVLTTPTPAAEPSPPPIVVSLPADAPPAAVANAIAEAVDRLIVRDDRANPLGAGDWRGARAAIGAFYAGRGFRPVWVDADGFTAAGRSATAQIARASEDGLTLGSLAFPRDLEGPLGPDALAAAEIAVAAAVVAYAEQATGSRLAPSRVSPIFSSEPEVADPGEALAEASAASDPGARLAAFNPPQKGYRALREALRRLDVSAEGDRPHPDAARPGLAATDAPDVSPDPTLGAGRTGKGRVRPRSLIASAAAESASRRARAQERAALLANMEIWRWEPREMGERRIEINIPDFSITVTDGGSVVMSSRVVVGKRETPTPVFSDRMRYVLINPSWRVPDSIIKKEMAPRLDHFVALGYEVKTVGGKLVVRQPPGDDNALGHLAFMFPNDHAVYLHDTPARQLFDEEMRALSHGCVRVEEPERLAEFVLGWSETRLEAAIGGPERTVFLPRPVPIHIEYFTAFVEADGALEERADVYGLAQRIARTLSAAGQD